MGFRGRWVNFAVIFPLLSMSSVYLQHRLTKCYLVSINCWSTVIYLKQLQYNSNWHATCTWVVPLSFLLLLCLPRPEAEMGYLVLSLLVFLSFLVWPALALHGRKKKFQDSGNSDFKFERKKTNPGDCTQLTGSEGKVLRHAVDLLRPRVSDRREGNVVVLPWGQLTEGVRSHSPVGQEATPGIQPSGHVDHKAIWDVSRVAAPGDQGWVWGHVWEGEVLWGKRPWG